MFAATLEGAFVGTREGTGWKPLPPHPAWWGLLVGFAFLADRPEGVFAVFHEGVIAARRVPEGGWVPLAQLDR